MALDLGGRHAEAERAYEWLRRQAAPRRLVARLLPRRRRRGPDPRHQRHLLRRHRRLAPLPRHRRHRVPPRAVADGRARHRLRARLPDARPARSRGAATTPTTARCSPARRASTTACAARIAIAERLGHERPDWELSLGALAIAIAHRPDVFLDKDRWAMDWYYPVLGGVLRGHAGARRASRRAGTTFVVDGRGVRCVSDRPWVTAAETCELVMALDADRRATSTRAELFTLGAVPARRRRRLLDRRQLRRRARSTATASSTRSSSPTWNSAAVVLAANALAGAGPTAGLFRGEGLPEGLNADELLAAGVEIEEERARERSPDRSCRRRRGAVRRARSDGGAEDAEAAGRRDGREAVGDRALPHLDRAPGRRRPGRRTRRGTRARRPGRGGGDQPS